MFRFTKKPLSGSHSQYLAKITSLVQCRYRRCQCYGGIRHVLYRHSTDNVKCQGPIVVMLQHNHNGPLTFLVYFKLSNLNKEIKNSLRMIS